MSFSLLSALSTELPHDVQLRKLSIPLPHLTKLFKDIVPELLPRFRTPASSVPVLFFTKLLAAMRRNGLKTINGVRSLYLGVQSPFNHSLTPSYQEQVRSTGQLAVPSRCQATKYRALESLEYFVKTDHPLVVTWVEAGDLFRDSALVMVSCDRDR